MPGMGHSGLLAVASEQLWLQNVFLEGSASLPGSRGLDVRDGVAVYMEGVTLGTSTCLLLHNTDCRCNRVAALVKETVLIALDTKNVRKFCRWRGHWYGKFRSGTCVPFGSWQFSTFLASHLCEYAAEWCCGTGRTHRQHCNARGPLWTVGEASRGFVSSLRQLQVAECYCQRNAPGMTASVSLCLCIRI